MVYNNIIIMSPININIIINNIIIITGALLLRALLRVDPLAADGGQGAAPLRTRGAGARGQAAGTDRRRRGRQPRAMG
jgi:hypothetical protein